MSDEPVAVTAQPAKVGQQSAGMLLRAAREATGLHIGALAVAMKVPVKKLEALETDRLDQLPDAVFVRALAGSVCRALKIDPAPVLSRLPQSVAPKFDRDDRGINMPYRAPDFHTGYSLKAMLNKPVVLVVVALLVAALAVLLVPESRTTVLSGNASVTPATSSPAASVTLPAQDGTATAERKVEAVVPVASATEVSPVAVAAPVAAAVPAAAVLPASAPRPAVGPDVIAFKVKSSTWVRVTDARGAVQFEKTLASGESGSASGFLPLTVVVGNVAATEVSVHGQAFALEAYAKDNVARFEVK